MRSTSAANRAALLAASSAVPFVFGSVLVWSSANEQLKQILAWGDAKEWTVGSCYYCSLCACAMLLPVAGLHLVLGIYTHIEKLRHSRS